MTSDLINTKKAMFLTGLLSIIMPYVALLGVYLEGGPFDFTNEYYQNLSISSAMYTSYSASYIVLSLSAFLFIIYQAYDSKIDFWMSTITGLSAFVLLLFPCKCCLSADRIGLFQLPAYTSHVIHVIGASIYCFTTGAIILFRFTLGSSDTKMKKVRNWLYRITGYAGISLIFLRLGPWTWYMKEWTCEAIAFTIFGFSYLIKSEYCPLLKD